MSLQNDRLSIFQQVERGELTMEEASQMLSRLDLSEGVGVALSAALTAIEPAAATGYTQPVIEGSQKPERSHLGSELWLIPFMLGVLLSLSAAIWMAEGWKIAALGWEFWLSFFPLMLGVLLMWFGWETRKARWLHLRVKQAPGKKPHLIAISLPLPAGLLRWGMRQSGRLSSNDHVQSAAQFIDEMSDAIAKDGPMHVLVDDEKDGNHVEIWIE